MSKYYVTQDIEQCIGCKACEVHCKTKNNSGEGAFFCKIMQVGPEMKNNLPILDFVYMACFHCEKPWCVNACPTGARKFGDLKDKSSEVYKIYTSGAPLFMLKPDMGTYPRLRYENMRQEVV